MTRSEPFDREAVLEILENAETPLPASDYVKAVKSRFGMGIRQARKVIQSLVDDQTLGYHYKFGTTFLEFSFNKPARVSPNIILHPPERKPQELQSGQIPVAIHPGISFGTGQHPTTRLCLNAIDACLLEKKYSLYPGSDAWCADIGTGSGVLALAMVRAGIKHCRAYEIDPVSVHEARKNIALNRMEKQIRLFDTPFSESGASYSMLCANLRWPTLKQLAKTIHASLKKGGIVILSGARVWETQALITCYTSLGFQLIHQDDEKKWAGVVLSLP